jgi:hypothetical protein
LITKRPELLGDLRSIFEPHWNNAIDKLQSKSVTAQDKFAISGYMANLMSATPAWRRVGVKMYNQTLPGYLVFAKRMQEAHGGVALNSSYEVSSVPQAHFKEKLACFSDYTLLEARPRNDQSVLRSETRHYTLKLTENADVGWGIAGFHLNGNSRLAEPHRTCPGDDVNATVCAGSRNLDLIEALLAVEPAFYCRRSAAICFARR